MIANTLETTITTASTPVRVRGTWLSDGFEALSFTSAGRITNSSSNSYTLTVKANYTATCGSSVSAVFILMRNGAEQVTSETVALSSTRADGSITASVAIAPGEFVELWVENGTNTANITVADARIEVE